MPNQIIGIDKGEEKMPVGRCLKCGGDVLTIIDPALFLGNLEREIEKL